MNNGILFGKYSLPSNGISSLSEYSPPPMPLPLSSASFRSIIPRVTAKTSITGQPGWNIENTVNGVGLPSNTPSLTANHAISGVGNSWRTNTFVTGASFSTLVLEFIFPRAYNLSGFVFWNLSSSLATQGINGVSVEYKPDTGSWTALPGGPASLAIGPISTTATIPPQTFVFSPVFTSGVRFSNMTNHGGTGASRRLGFSEIQFFTFIQ